MLDHSLLVCLTMKATHARTIKCENYTYCPFGTEGATAKVCIEDGETADDVCKRSSKCEQCKDISNYCYICPGSSVTRAVPEEQLICPDPFYSGSGSRNFSEGQWLDIFCWISVYDLHVSGRIVCQKYGAWSIWSSVLPKCNRLPAVTSEKKAVCGDPGFVRNGILWNTDGYSNIPHRNYKEGESVVYVCMPGDFVLEGSAELTCQKDGTWSSPVPECIKLSADAPKKALCQDPGSVTNGIRRNSDGSSESFSRNYEEGESVVYFCLSEDFILEGSAQLTCQKDGTWSSSIPKCIKLPSDTPVNSEIKCLDPGQVDNADRLNIDGSPSIGVQLFAVGQSLVYTCHQGFALRSRSLITCLATGKWSFEKPYCTHLFPPSTTTTTEFSPQSCCKYPGGIDNGLVTYLPSQDDRRWDSICDGLEEDEQYPLGSRLKYTCDDGYNVDGSSTLRCEATGQWSSAPPTCVNDEPFSCENPGPILDGRVWYYPPPSVRNNSPGSSLDYDADEFVEQSVLMYTCDEGYRLEGARRLFCQSTGFWSAAIPTCVPDCGRSFLSQKINQRVANGSQTVSGDWPWMVSISAESRDGSAFICGGAIINSHTILTAAHCLGSGGTLILRFGKHNFRNRDDDLEVLVLKSRRVVIHPDYSSQTLDSDIGLIRVAQRIRFSIRVQPICLPTALSSFRNIMTGRMGYISGWGVTELALPADQLMLARLPVVSRKLCQITYLPLNLTITSNMFCAGYDDARQSVCDGDSGSPFVFYDSRTERYTIEGLVSYGVTGQCGVAGKYAIFTKVFRFVEWILRNSQ